MLEVTETFMQTNDLQEPESPMPRQTASEQRSLNAAAPEPAAQSLQDTASQDSILNQPGRTVAESPSFRRTHAENFGYVSAVPRNSRKTRRRGRYATQRTPFWSRVRSPILQCRRCGERYRASWTVDIRCPKCGRRPPKVQPWEGALYALVFPVALIGSVTHFGRSPRNSAIALCVGLAGLLIEGAIYLLSQ
jgi:hypothetical protein